ncbi:MAG TPA: NCS2 family permease [Trueperaceae bacterium]
MATKSTPARSGGPLDRYFGVSREGSSIPVEIRAGITTFLTMAYILFVNPQILGTAITIDGVNVISQLLTTTALAAAIGTLLMGVLARYPFALAPGMGLNAYFTYSVVLGLGIDWRTALGAVFLSGIVFLALSFVGTRELIINAIPANIKLATAAGIGLFLAIIGSINAGIVVDNPATLVGLGDLRGPGVLLSIFGLVIIGTLLALRVRGAILIGIVLTSILAIVTRAPVYGGEAFAGFGGPIVRAPVWPTDIFLQMDIGGALGLGILGVVFIFFFVDMFDTAGTLLGISEKAGFVDDQGRLPRATQAFSADAIATIAGATLGTSTVTSYVESAAGIEDGGRTGLTAVVVGVLFLLSIFFWPLAAAVPGVATAPALIIVGAMMMSNVSRVDWDDYSNAIPAFLTVIGMPLTYSIANGISFGIISYVLIKLLSGRTKEIHWLMVVLAALLVARYAYIGGI